jgi:hypothetical protein
LQFFHTEQNTRLQGVIAKGIGAAAWQQLSACIQKRVHQLLSLLGALNTMLNQKSSKIYRL